MVDNKDWSIEEVNLLKELRPHTTITELSNVFAEKGFERSRKAIERKACNLGIFYIEDSAVEIAAPEEGTEYAETWDRIVDIKKEYIQDFEQRNKGLATSGKLRKILCLSDFHIPFEREDLIKKVIEEHKDADLLVINGDMLDLHAISTWPKEKSIALRKEYAIAIEYMSVFSKIFPHVVMTRGNHENRLNNYFHSNVSPAISFLVNKEILSRIAAGEVYDSDGNIVKKFDFSNVIYDAGPEAWFTKIGRTMFIHPQSFSSVAAQTAVNAQEYFMEREDVDCIVVGHTHQMAYVPTRGKLCIEQGCLCVPLDYEKQGKLKFKPQTLGYAVIYQDEQGNCDFNKSRPVYLGIQYPIKRSVEDIMERL